MASNSAYGNPSVGMQPPAPSYGGNAPQYNNHNAFSAPAPAQQPVSNSSDATGGGRGVLSSAYTSAAQTVKGTGTATIVKVMRVANLVNGVLLIVMGVLALLQCEYPSWSGYILGFHAIAFGTLLACFELRVGDRITSFVDRNFGFLFNSTGRTVFLIFLATIPFSLMGGTNCSVVLEILTGVFTVCNSLFNCIVIYNHPGFQKNGVVSRLEKQRQDAAASGMSTGVSSGFVDDIDLGRSSQFDTAEQQDRRGTDRTSMSSTFSAATDNSENPFEHNTQNSYGQSAATYSNTPAPSTTSYQAPPVPAPAAASSSYSVDVPVPTPEPRSATEASAEDNPFAPSEDFSDTQQQQVGQDLQASSAMADENPFEKSSEDNPFADQSVRDVL